MKEGKDKVTWSELGISAHEFESTEDSFHLSVYLKLYFHCMRLCTKKGSTVLSGQLLVHIH